MSQYLVLSKIEVQNANSIAGFTWGFPAITQFLGFTHALSRKISNKFQGTYSTEFTGCVVVANKVENKVYQPKPYADFEFLQSRNPPVLASHKDGKKVPIIEEGKLNATVSLVLELSDTLLLSSEDRKVFEQSIKNICLSMRLAGGSILNLGCAKLFSANSEQERSKQLKHIKRLCMPGFVLQDRSQHLLEHSQSFEELGGATSKSLEAWLDFSALKMVANPLLAEGEDSPSEQTKAKWEFVNKPFDGYLVPIMTGYKAISDRYEPGQVEAVRDPNIPAYFAEAVHSVAEWKSMHRVEGISNFVWRYRQEQEWYLCQQQSAKQTDTEQSDQITELLNNLF